MTTVFRSVKAFRAVKLLVEDNTPYGRPKSSVFKAKIDRSGKSCGQT